MQRGPLLTLAVVTVLATVLLVLDQVRASSTTIPSGATQNTSASGAAAAPSDTGSPQAATPQITFPTQAQYTGHTEGSEASIAVTVHNARISAYLCDGKAIEGWYQGRALNGVIAAEGRGSNVLRASLSGSTLFGTVTAKGRSWSFSVVPVSSPAGLYRSKIGTITVGWIKDPDGSVTGLANDNGVEQPAPPLDPTTAHFVDGGDTVVGQ